MPGRTATARSRRMAQRTSPHVENLRANAAKPMIPQHSWLLLSSIVVTRRRSYYFLDTKTRLTELDSENVVIPSAVLAHHHFLAAQTMQFVQQARCLIPRVSCISNPSSPHRYFQHHRRACPVSKCQTPRLRPRLSIQHRLP